MFFEQTREEGEGGTFSVSAVICIVMTCLVSLKNKSNNTINHLQYSVAFHTVHLIQAKHFHLCPTKHQISPKSCNVAGKVLA